MHTHFLLAVVVTGSAAGSAGPVARRNTGARAEYVHLGRGPCVGPSDSFSDHFASFRITGKRKSCAVLCSAASFCTGFEWRPQSRKCRLLKSEIAGSDETKPWSKKRCFKRKNPGRKKNHLLMCVCVCVCVFQLWADGPIAHNAVATTTR